MNTRKTLAEAEADRIALQAQVDAAGEGANIVTKVVNLQRYTELMLPVGREAEYDAASDADKLRFLSVCEKAFARTGEDFVTAFNEEYELEFG